MGVAQRETPTGAIDGVNTVYATSVAYTAGTLAVYVDGALVAPACVTETDPSAGTFTLADPPLPSPGAVDVLEVEYEDTTTAPAVQLVAAITVAVTSPGISVDVDAGDIAQAVPGASVSASAGAAGVSVSVGGAALSVAVSCD